MTAWNPLIPNVNNVPANDAQSMQQNFAVLNSAFQQDHTALSNAVNQGMHKQITFPQPPASLPFPNIALQSYEYERTMAPVIPANPTLSYLEYQSAGPNPNNIVPLSMKAWGILVPITTGAPFVTILAGFNIDPANTNRPVISSPNFNIGFLNSMPNLNYMVFYGGFGTTSFTVEKCIAKNLNSITIATTGVLSAGNSQIFFMVL